MVTTAAPTELAAEDVYDALRVHADRVHDAVRRQGASREQAAEIVQRSARESVDRARTHPEEGINGLVGWWFARARVLSRDAPVDEGALPLGSGLLAKDAEQARLAEALELRPDRERMALLMRDAYDLPAEVVAAALGTDADQVMELVGTARARLLPTVYDTDVPSLKGHGIDEASLARVAEGGQVQARDATTRRHAQTCPRCRPHVEAQDDARRLMAGLSVVAMADEDREALLGLSRQRTSATLSSRDEVARRAALAAEVDDEPLPRRLFAPIPVLAAILIATLFGLFLGNLLSNDDRGGFGPAQAVVPLTVPPPKGLDIQPQQLPGDLGAEGTEVFTLPPTTPPPPPTTAPAIAGLLLSQTAGANNAEVLLTGSSWEPNLVVTIEYLDPLGVATGSTTTAVPDESGAFTVSLTLSDPTEQIGDHSVVATNGTTTVTATYTVV